MSPTKLSPDDPRLTAYALGELDREESEIIASAIQHDPAAQKVVREIQALQAKLELALADEPIERLAPLSDQKPLTKPGRLIPFPSYYLVGGMAAACFALLLVVQQSPNDGQAGATASAPKTEAAPAASVQALDSDAIAASGVAKARRLPGENVPDIRPAPAVEGGLQLGRTVVSADPAPRASRDLSPLRSYGSGGNARDVASQAGPDSDVFLRVAGHPLSTISVTGAGGAYREMRALLQGGRLPAPDAISIEQMLNHFAYSSVSSRQSDALDASVEVATAPWNPSHRLVRIGVKGRDIASAAPQGASDLKLQVEFNPEQAKSYRLIGYAQSSASGAVDSSGSASDKVVTALYEVVPVGAPEPLQLDSDPLRYASADTLGSLSTDPRSRELLTLRVRYKAPTVDVNRKIEIPLIDPGTDFSKASKDFKFAAAVAGFGMLLTESPHKGTATYDKVLTWAQEGQVAEDPEGRQTEFIEMVKKAKAAVE